MNLWRAFLLLNLTACIVCFPWFLREQQSLLQDDSGIFLYMGQQVSEGQRLYQDVWDNKPPLIFWWNALGCLLYPASPLGVCAIAALHIILAANLIFVALYRDYGIGSCLLGAVLFLSGASTQLLQPNFTETYALPWQVLLAYLGLMALRKSPGTAQSLLAGLCVAFVFFTRPNHIGAGAFYLLCLMLGAASWPSKTRALLWSAGGLLAGFSIVSLPFWLSNGWSEFWSGSLTFNMFYYAKQRGLAHKAAAWIVCTVHLTRSGILPMALAALAALWFSQKKLASLLAFWLLLEMGLASMSGHFFEHYFVIVLVAASFSIGVGFHAISRIDQGRHLVTSLSAAFMILLALARCWDAFERAREPLIRESPRVRQILSRLGPNDRFLYWGQGLRPIWYLAKRPAPISYFQTAPVLTSRVQYQYLSPKLLADTLKALPEWLIENTREPLSLEPGEWDTLETLNLKRELMSKYDLVLRDTEEIFWKRKPLAERQ